MVAAGAPNPSFWRGRRVLVTGHTGFKGTWAALWLARMGAQVSGLALAPHTQPAMFDLTGAADGIDHRIVDLRDRAAVTAAVREARPDIVLHLAAQAILRRGVREPLDTFDANVMGTVHLLEALRASSGLRAILVVTTDKVYENADVGRPFVESDRLGGNDPYSASKAAVELVTRAYAASYFVPRGVAVATARGGNVIGGGDFGEDRLIPDIVRAVWRNDTLRLRYPDATRPWHHVLDCLAGYFAYAEPLALGREVPAALNFGPDGGDEVPVRAVAEALLDALGSPREWSRDTAPITREVARLSLDSTQARTVLDWSDRLPGNLGIDWTASWYRAYRQGEAMRGVTVAQIEAYERLRSQKAAPRAQVAS
jgi:CDP-glucose 4,6-dehydratase